MDVTGEGDVEGREPHGAPEGAPEGAEPAAEGAVTDAGAPDDAGAEADWVARLEAKDAEIEELRARVADAARTAEATEALNAQIAELKRQMADERTEFELRAAGARNVTAARALLEERGGDVAALREAEPWLFSPADAAATGSTGLEPAGAAGGDDGDLRRWERLAGLDGEGEE